MNNAFLLPSAALNDSIEMWWGGVAKDWLGACNSPQENRYTHCSQQLT